MSDDTEDNVITIFPEKDKEDGEFIANIKLNDDNKATLLAFLQEMVSEAEDGQVVGICFVVAHKDHSDQSGFIGHIPKSALGEIEIMKSELIEEARKDRIRI